MMICPRCLRINTPDVHTCTPTPFVRELERQLAECQRERDELVALLDEAVQDISDWGAYASDYFQEKWNLNGCIEKYKAAIAKLGADKGEVG